MRPKRWHILLLGSFAVSVAQQTYVGGDTVPLSRFVIPTSLGLLVLAGEGIHRATSLFMLSRTHVRGTIVRAALVLLGIVAINARFWDEALLMAKALDVPTHLTSVRYVHAVNKIADANASVAVVAAGAFPYFSRRQCFDEFGRCDPHIARLRADPRFPRAGHNKMDLVYTVSTYRPDIVLHAVDTVHPEFFRYYRPIAVEVDGTEMAFCVRKGSPKVHGGRPVDWRTLADHLNADVR